LPTPVRVDAAHCASDQVHRIRSSPPGPVE
jgi:hypothetical protein